MSQINTIESILPYIDRTSQLPCWVWQGAILNNGYGKVTVNYQTRLVHRFVYTELKGPIQEGLELDHTCRNRLCVNPEHLDQVTSQENNRRRDILITTCRQGHPLSGDNLYMTPDGRRNCRTCRRISSFKFTQYKAPTPLVRRY